MSLAARDLPASMTAEEFLAWPDELPFTELIEGTVVENVPTVRHNRLVVELHYRFRRFADDHPGAGELGFGAYTLINDANVYIPDAWWVPDEQRLANDQRGYREALPPLVIEVRSPSTWRYDTGVKLRRYEERGVAEVWLVDGDDDVVTVHRRSAPDTGFDVQLVLRPGDVLATPLVPGWELDVADLLAR